MRLYKTDNGRTHHVRALFPRAAHTPGLAHDQDKAMCGVVIRLSALPTAPVTLCFNCIDNPAFGLAICRGPEKD